MLALWDVGTSVFRKFMLPWWFVELSKQRRVKVHEYHDIRDPAQAKGVYTLMLHCYCYYL